MKRLEENEKRYGKLQFIFYIILVPGIFTIVLTAIIFTFLGYDVVEATKNLSKNIPFVSKLVTEDEEKSEPIDPAEKLHATEQELSSVQEELGELQSELQQKEMEIVKLEQMLLQQEQKEEEALENARLTEEARTQKNRELAQLYGGMSAKRAAAILEKLTLHEAALILQEMDAQQHRAIMERFDPAFAANLTVTLKELDLVADPNMAALQERVLELIGMLDEKVEPGQEQPAKLSMNHLVSTFTKLPPAQAASIFEKMGETEQDFKLAATILAVMSDESRSSIFAVMPAELVVKYTNALAS